MHKIAQALNSFGGHSMVNVLESVLVRRPNQALGHADPCVWHYTNKINLTKAIEQHDKFVQMLAKENVKIIYHDAEHDELADAIFVHDPALITDYGAIILRMGKVLRMGEEELLKNKLTELKIPIMGEIVSPGLVEGGDLLWLNEKTLLAGNGFRTNQQGINQLRKVLKSFDIEVIDFDLPYFQGKEACLHLQSLMSLVDTKIALCYLQLLPTRLYQLLLDKNFQIIEVPEQEFLSMAPNTLAIKPKLVITVEGNPKTKANLEKAGVKVLTYEGSELSLKTEGGPTCLTRPIKRS